MNAEERQALREKHTPRRWLWKGEDICDGCLDNSYDPEGISYPCDTIRVLDAWETSGVMPVAQIVNQYFNSPICEEQ